jgi:hypothetical protein
MSMPSLLALLMHHIVPITKFGNWCVGITPPGESGSPQAQLFLQTLVEKNRKAESGVPPVLNFFFDYSLPDLSAHGAGGPGVKRPRQVNLQPAPKKRVMRRPAAAAAEEPVEAAVDEPGAEMDEEHQEPEAEEHPEPEAEAEEPEAGGDGAMPVLRRPAAAAATVRPPVVAAVAVVAASFGCAKCRRKASGCAQCKGWADAGLKGYFRGPDNSVQRAP